MILNLELANVVTQELFRLEKQIDETAKKVFDTVDRNRMLTEILFVLAFDEEEEEAKKRLSSSKYLNTHSKINCAFAAYFLCIANANAMEALETMISDGFFHSMEFISRGCFFIGAAENHHEGVLEKSRFASVMADIRHAETRSIKKEAIDYYAANYATAINNLVKKDRGKAKDNAATDLTKQQPITFRTARGYIDEYHRENTAS